MFWDIAIVAGVAFTQLVITWYGVHVSVKENRTRNAFIIGILGAIGMALMVYGAVRSSVNQNALQAQLDKIQRNTEQPAKVEVTMPPLPKQRALIALAGDSMADGVLIQRDKNPPHMLFVKHSCKNIGSTITAKNVGCVAKTWKVPAKEGIPAIQTQRESWSEFSKLVKSRNNDGIDLAPGAGIWNTNDLGMTEMEPEFVRGDKVILLTGAILYGDDAGSHKKEFCMWAQPPVSAPYPVWHSCDIGHNREVY